MNLSDSLTNYLSDRKIMQFSFLLVLCALTVSSYAQEVETEKPILTESQIRVRNTTKWAACVPGSGQVINRKYWKAPIVLGALSTSVFFIIDNTATFNEFKDNLLYLTDDDPLTIHTLTDDQGVLYSETELRNNAYLFRRYRDLSYLACAGIYLLQIIDANVDAHMRFFDSNDDLSFSLVPPNSGRVATNFWQVGLKLNIK